jgi:hypothetical protein
VGSEIGIGASDGRGRSYILGVGGNGEGKFTAETQRSAEFNATDGVVVGWETWKNAPKNGGGPEGTPPERLRYRAAMKGQRVADGIPESSGQCIFSRR